MRLRVEQEQIETTRSGLFGGPADVVRTFTPGVTRVTLEGVRSDVVDVPGIGTVPSGTTITYYAGEPPLICPPDDGQAFVLPPGARVSVEAS